MMLTLLLALVVRAWQTPAQPAATPVASSAPSGSAVPATGESAAPGETSPAPGAAALPSPPADAAVIRNSGSTNTVGYFIVVSPNGHTLIAQNGTTRYAVLPAPQTKWLFAKLQEAEPLAGLPRGRCMRSVSFGSTTTVAYHGVMSPDLGCAVSPLERELARTVGAIVNQLHISTLPSHRLRLLEHIRASRSSRQLVL